MTPNEKIDAFIAFLELHRLKLEAAEAEKRREAEDKKLEQVRAWWLDAAQ